MSEATISVDTNSIFQFIVAPLVVAAVLGTFAYFRRRFRCIDELKEKSEKTDERTLRQSRAMIASAYRQDEITAALHPDSPVKSNLGPLTESLLKDGEGNL
jgi:flagellar basal body-associated protein FliL